MGNTGPLTRWSGQVVTQEAVLPGSSVVFSGQRIHWVGPCNNVPSEWKGIPDTTPEGTKYILPGLIDVHCHGGAGESFPDATDLGQIRTAAAEHLRAGTTTLVGSLVTAPLAVLAERAALLAQATNEGIIAGIHFEGPFLSVARCGAQDPRHLLDPTVETIQALAAAASGTGLSMTIAPERFAGKGGKASLNALVDSGIVPSWGHTDAGASVTRKAIAMGISAIARNPLPGLSRASVTHLFNGMRPLHHRAPGPVGELLAAAKAGDLILELICDGVHLDPQIVRTVVELVGRENCIFVTDAMAATGMPDGHYQLGPLQTQVIDGVARLDGGDSLAGGTSRLIDCVRVAVTQSGIDLVDSVFMASTQGARLFGWPKIGAIEAGRRADLVAIDGDYDVVQVQRAGRKVF